MGKWRQIFYNARQKNGFSVGNYASLAAAWLLAARGGEWRRRLKGPNLLLLLQHISSTR